jgi:hypothetical protein
MHGIVEYLAECSSAVFGSVHGDLSVAQHVLGLGASATAERNADACSHNNFMTIRIEGKRQLLLDTLGNTDGITGVAQFLG